MTPSTWSGGVFANLWTSGNGTLWAQYTGCSQPGGDQMRYYDTGGLVTVPDSLPFWLAVRYAGYDGGAAQHKYTLWCDGKLITNPANSANAPYYKFSVKLPYVYLLAQQSVPNSKWDQLGIAAGDIEEVVTVPGARQAADGKLVAVNAAIVTVAFTNYFYIEADNRCSGIRVEYVNSPVVAGDRADVEGVVRTDAAGERYIEAFYVAKNGTGTVAPLGVINKTIASTHAGIGLTVQGLFVKTWGRVRYVGSNIYYVDDATGCCDNSTTDLAGQSVNGVRVVASDGQAMPSEGLLVQVKGCVGRYMVSPGSMVPIVRTASFAYLSGTEEQSQREALDYLMDRTSHYLADIAALGPTDGYYQGRRVTFLTGIAQQYLTWLQTMLGGGHFDPTYLRYAANGLHCAQAAYALVQDPLATTTVSRPTRPITFSTSLGAQEEVCANGRWQCRFNVGPNTPPTTGWTYINVPHDERPDYLPPYMGLPTSILDNPTSPMWYKTTFYIPQEWSTRVVKLRFEAVTHYAEVFVNNVYCGNHVGSFGPFEIDITNALTPGALNTCYVYVENDSYSGLPDKPAECLFSAYRYTAQPYQIGVCGDVSLKSYPLVYVQKNLIDTSVQNDQIHVRTYITNRDSVSHSVTLTNTVQSGGTTVLTVGSQVVGVPANSTAVAEMTQSWSSYNAWAIGGSYGDPANLYFLKSQLVSSSTLVDTSYTRFGFREFRTSGGYFYLNNSLIYLQDGGAAWGTPGNALTARPWLFRFFKTYREANCNIVRNFSPCFNVYFDVADEMGMLCENQWEIDGPWEYSGELRTPGGDPYDPVWSANVKNEYQQWVEKDYNHPSVVMWSSNNEVFAGEGHVNPVPTAHSSFVVDKFIEFHQLIHSVDQSNRPVDSHGNQGHRFDTRFEIVNLHYPYAPNFQNWQSLYGGRPTIVGEFWPGQECWSDMARSPDPVRAAQCRDYCANQYELGINGMKSYDVPGIMPHNLLSVGYFCSASLGEMGPWADLFKNPLTLYTDYWWDERV